MEKIIRYLFLSSLLLFAVNAASAQSKGKQKEKPQQHEPKAKDKISEKHGRKAKGKKARIGERPPNKAQIANHKKRKGQEKQKAHEKKLRANKEYVKANKQKRKEKSNDEY